MKNNADFFARFSTFFLLILVIVGTLPLTFGIGINEPEYVGIADYYDDRKAVVTVSADDWHQGQDAYFDDMGSMLVGKNIYYTGAINSGLNPNWTQIQYWLDQGFLEAASHSRTHKHLADYTVDDYDLEVGGSKADILGNLTLPSSHSYGGSEYVYSWIEPWGESDATVRQKLGEYRYLSDRRYLDGYIGWAGWDSVNGLFDGIGQTIRMENTSGGVTDYRILNSAFDSAYGANGIYHLMTHPDGVDWSKNQYADRHTSYISNRNDVWYVPFGLLYLYHWVDSQNIPQITSTGSLGNKIFQISIDSTNRQNYGAKFPVTYVFDIPSSWTNPYVNYRFQPANPWTQMETKTSSDFFNGINAVRFDLTNRKAYVSIGFDEISNNIYLQILPENGQPVADFVASPTSGSAPLTVGFTDQSISSDGIVSWLWDFGDATTSSEQNPIHTYNQGTYDVSLTVAEADGDTDVETKIGYITVTAQGGQVIFSDGFESGDLSSWTGDRGSSGNSRSVVSTPVHDGSYALNHYLSSGGGWSAVYKDYGVGYSTVYARAYVQFDSLAVNGEHWNLGLDITNVGAVNDFVRCRLFNDAGTLKWELIYYTDAGYVSDYSTTPAISVDTWYSIELKWVKGAGTGEVGLWIDGVSVIQVSGLDNDGGGDSTSFWCTTGHPFGIAHNLYVDSVVVADSYIGP